MINRCWISLLTLLLVAAVAGSAADPASTAPASGASDTTLDAGRIVFSPPEELTFLGKRDDDRSAGYALGNNRGLITILVTPQEHAVRPELAPRLAQLLIKTIHEESARGEFDMVLPPRVEKDGRFLLRLHDRFNTGQRLGDRVQMYRAVGLYLVCVVSTAFTDDPEEARQVHDLSAEMLLSLRLSRPTPPRPAAATPTTRPVTFQNARIRLAPPAGWEAEPTDHAGGIIVIYRDPEEASHLITVTVRTLPEEARRDPKIRDIAIEQMVLGERQSFRIDGTESAGATRDITDRRFLRKTSTEYRHGDRRFVVTSRHIRAGDVVASVTAVAPDDSATALDHLADRVALTIRPLSAR
jgi:hypothetical protein